MKRIILRADDIAATTEPADLHRVYDPCWERGLPVCLSVIPRSAYRFIEPEPEPVPPADLRENPSLCALLVELARADLAEIALHGWEHCYGEMARESEATISGRIMAGLEVLRDALPGIPVRVLVPPHDYISPAGVRAARQHQLILCSTWAACHGGTYLAHRWARIRCLAGLPFALFAGKYWSTDVALLDFLEAESQDRPMTRRLLERAAHQHSPVVLTQHFWRLLDAHAMPNVRYERWLRWLAWLLETNDVEFVRYGDR